MRLGYTETEKNLMAVTLGIWVLAFGFFAQWYEEILPNLYTVNRVLANVEAPKQPLPEVLEEEVTWDLSQTETTIISESSESEIKRKIREVFGEDADVAIAVAMAESKLNPGAIGDTHLEKPSYGLFQVSRIYHGYSVEELLDPEKNIEVAKDISSKGRGWENWTTYREGSHVKYLK